MDIRSWLDFSNSKLSVKRSVWSYAKIEKLVAAVIRNRHIQLRDMNGSPEYLNAGCGLVLAPGCCNLDYLWRPGVLCWDVTKGIPFATASLQGIFTEHCLEHLSYDNCQAVLREFHRTLRRGGVARVIVPDGELYCRLYVQAIDGRATNWPYSEPGKTPMAYVNRIMRDCGHQFVYDYQTLRQLMLEAGFQEVHKATYRQGREPKLLLDQEHRAVESLYVEGIA